MKNRLSTRLLAWYHKHKRILPWRDHPDPYAVWVSEIMLQQTRVDTVIPYFEKWMNLFPTVQALASASERDVLTAWEGLGYYSRARNLHKAAKVVTENFNGELPRDLEDLRSLPGVGRYTVGAIASMAFGMDEPTLDGNLRRVFARLFDVEVFADSPAGEKILWGLAAENLPKGQAGDYNQALMDLGATICLPKNPRCLLCPLMDLCKARENGTQEIRPVLKPKKGTPQYIHAAAVILRHGRVLLSQRPADGLLGGMWEFPNARVETDPARELAKALKMAAQLQVKCGEALEKVEHAYSHFKVIVHPFYCEAVSIPKKKDLKWVRLVELEDYPMGKVDRQIARKIK
ncbi:MAG TPA: A/G-specific adenine glycosylase [Anaerolineales bacterium]|nr:A/G-specific adenine glycosylase [Anaerolineales bacterium]HNN13207.1 A/G-specific adenine glycosylase [Anaerolineales bacterium]HNO31077.1 A/G-specific adenine glycosylase [Anaerolineales bacterium]